MGEKRCKSIELIHCNEEYKSKEIKVSHKIILENPHDPLV